uniref:RT_RNaseH_2 domain-containing protein n=1 Tax=Strongyloides venezuelensis TaxID=75913 RepID=A0A0K0FCA8_STRVS
MDACILSYLSVFDLSVGIHSFIQTKINKDALHNFFQTIKKHLNTHVELNDGFIIEKHEELGEDSYQQKCEVKFTIILTTKWLLLECKESTILTLKLNFLKYQFSVSSTEFLGYQITEGSLEFCHDFSVEYSTVVSTFRKVSNNSKWSNVLKRALVVLNTNLMFNITLISLHEQKFAHVDILVNEDTMIAAILLSHDNREFKLARLFSHQRREAERTYSEEKLFLIALVEHSDKYDNILKTLKVTLHKNINGVVYWDDKIYIQTSLYSNLFQFLHRYHLGIPAMKRELKVYRFVVKFN